MKVQAIRTLILAVAAMLVGTLAMAQGYSIRAGDTLSIEVLEDPFYLKFLNSYYEKAKKIRAMEK